MDEQRVITQNELKYVTNMRWQDAAAVNTHASGSDSGCRSTTAPTCSSRGSIDRSRRPCGTGVTTCEVYQATTKGYSEAR